MEASINTLVASIFDNNTAKKKALKLASNLAVHSPPPLRDLYNFGGVSEIGDDELLCCRFAV